MRVLSLTLARVWIVLAVTTSPLWAAVPAPPVNQFLGIPDSTFANLVEADCRFCHNQTPPIAAVDPSYLPDRHHNLLGQTVPPRSAAPYAQAGQTYQCLSCHSLGPDPATGRLSFQMFRDCALCHRQLQGRPTVHHATAHAQAGQCVICHGNLVNDRGDGHYIPSYNPSLVTPWPSNKPNGGPRGEGNCNFCHNTIALPFFNPAPVIDPASGVRVFRNADTHHATGFVLDAAKCAWCHNITPGINNAFSIRTCQNCHGVDSLHNIQYDDAGDGIIPGMENPGFGHIGANRDCVGCHGFSAQTLSAPGAGPVTPTLNGLSRATAVAGQTTRLTLYGNAFISQASATAASAFPLQVQLTDSAGRTSTVEPLEVSSGELRFELPGELPPGNYRLRVLKQNRLSNPLALALRPAVSIDVALCRDGRVEVRGSGFGGYDPAPEAGTGIDVRLQTQTGGKKGTIGQILLPGEILSWSDAQIRARVAACGEYLSLNSVFGTASVPLAQAAKPVPRVIKIRK